MFSTKGFTLAELMAVMVIIALLAGMGIGAYRQAAERSYFNEGLELGGALTEAINQYYYENSQLSAASRMSPTVAGLDVTFTSKGACQSVEDALKPYCVKGRYFEVYYSTDDQAVYASRVKNGVQKDYTLIFYPQFSPNRMLEQCQVEETSSGNYSKTGESVCFAMGYTQQDGRVFRKPYGYNDD